MGFDKIKREIVFDSEVSLFSIYVKDKKKHKINRIFAFVFITAKNLHIT